MYEKKRLSEERELHNVMSSAAMLTRAIKKIPEDRDVYIRVTLNTESDEDRFYVSHWTSWEDGRTGEKLVFLASKDRSVITDFSNVYKVEFFYEKPEDPEAIGYKDRREKEITAQGK